MQVKENQATLLNDCRDTVDFKIPDERYQEPVVRKRNRIESRTVEIFKNMIITDDKKWNLVEAIIKVERRREVFDTKAKKWKNSDETSFYISTTILSAKEFCVAIRNHWGIENSNHYVRDVSMNEDKSRVRINADIFARLRSFALNIMRSNGVKNISSQMYGNALKLDNVLNYRGVI